MGKLHGLVIPVGVNQDDSVRLQVAYILDAGVQGATFAQVLVVWQHRSSSECSNLGGSIARAIVTTITWSQ